MEQEINYDAMSYVQLAELMIELDEAHERAKSAASIAWDNVSKLKREVIPARMNRDQIRNITVNLSNGESKQLLVLPQVSVKTPPDKRDELYNWLVENGADDIISQTVNSSTLAAFVRRQMEAGEDYPHDICEVSMYEVASLRKA